MPEQLARDLQEEREYKQKLNRYSLGIRQAMESIAADHRVGHYDYAHRLWMCYVINRHTLRAKVDNHPATDSIQPREEHR